MFGYIRIDKPDLRVREYETYRAVYCGLCRSMGKCTGCSSRMTLSYDFAYLLVLRLILSGTKPEYISARCPAHPLKKRLMLESNAESEYVACAAALLLYYKCKDDLADERGKKRLLARTLFPSVKRMRRRALRRRPDMQALDAEIRDAMTRLSEAERAGTPSVDRYADLSGDMLARIFAFGLPDRTGRIARQIGYHTGKWIYLLDAFDDLKEDAERGRFNPYLLLWGDECGGGIREEKRETVRVALLSELLDAENAIDLVDFDGYGDLSGVVRNILYGGMPRTAEGILRGENERKGRRRGSAPSAERKDER